MVSRKITMITYMVNHKTIGQPRWLATITRQPIWLVKKLYSRLYGVSNNSY